METMTIKQLKQAIQELEKQGVAEETKIFLDTGWDSVQEIDPQALKKERAVPFQIQDDWTKEYYHGFALEEKAQTKEITGEVQDIIVLHHPY